MNQKVAGIKGIELNYPANFEPHQLILDDLLPEKPRVPTRLTWASTGLIKRYFNENIESQKNTKLAIKFVSDFCDKYGNNSDMARKFLIDTWNAQTYSSVTNMKKRERFLMSYLSHHVKEFVPFKVTYSEIEPMEDLSPYSNFRQVVQNLFHMGLELDDKLLMR